MSIFDHKIERSGSSHAILEVSSRKMKARKIVAILSEQATLDEASLLDIGTGSGQIAYEFSNFVKKVHSVDIVDERKNKKKYTFKLVHDEKIPFDDSVFDIVVSNHVIEHTKNQALHVAEIMRVLKPGGIAYLATPNKWWLRDPHYKLPFISWMPRSVGAFYLRTTQGKEWDVFPVSHYGIRKYFADSSEIINALPYLLKGKAAKELDVWKGVSGIARRLPFRMLDFSKFVSPTLIYIIKK